jgi:uncharacterized lipoprotein YmbA
MTPQHLNPMKTRISASILLPLSLALLAACNVVPPPQSDATRYYLLSSPSLPASAPSSSGLRLGLRSVDVAEYLRNRSIIVRQGANELVPDDYNRWAESLEAGISRVLRTSLVAAPNVGRVLAQPFPLDSDRDYDIAVTVLHCEGVRSGESRGASHFSALVEIISGGPNPTVLARLNFTAPDLPWNGRDYDELAARLSESVSGLARAIVAALPAAPQK